jgi:hypothetical protein
MTKSIHAWSRILMAWDSDFRALRSRRGRSAGRCRGVDSYLRNVRQFATKAEATGQREYAGRLRPIA